MEIGSNHINNKSLFVSRALDHQSPFYKLALDYNISITDKPLIKTVQIPFSHTPQADWIFFSSKNAIRYFFAQNPDVLPGVKYGVISHSSEQELSVYAKQPAFIGQGTDLIKIARSFRDIVGNSSVLFPQAMDSLQTMQKQLAFTNTVYNLYSYKTLIQTDFDLPYTDIVVFTSPSNVKAYFSKYKIDTKQVVVAMGHSTKYKLSEYGVRNVLLPCEFSENGLCDVLIHKHKGIINFLS